MYRKFGLLVLVLVFMFLFTGLAYAACLKYVCVKEPGGVNDSLNPGSVSNIELTSGPALPTNVKISKEKLEYKCSGDTDWTLITIRSCNPVSGCPSIYPWEVPFTPKDDCNMKVTILDANGVKLAGDQGGLFSIGEVSLKIMQPNGGEELMSGQQYTVVWNSGMKDVVRSVLSYKCDDMLWTKIVSLPGNPLFYKWDVPAPADNCKVKVILKDSSGTILATDQSDGTFEIIQAP
jgi:hypothetical protein